MSYRSSVSSQNRSSSHAEYDILSWKRHEVTLQQLKIDASNLDTHIRHLEKAWQEAEMNKPENQGYQDRFLEWIQALKEADALIYQVARLCDDAPAWRLRWTPASPYEIQRAYHCVYAHALGLFDNERVSPAKVVEVLREQLADSRRTFAGFAGVGGEDVEGETST